MPLRHPMSVLLATFAFGSIALAKQPVSAVCTTAPLVTFAGATISVHVTPDGFLPHRKLTYTYRSTDGEVTGDGASTGTVNTMGLQPGNYNVSSLVSDDHKPKRTLVATCQSSFTIKEPPKYPPQMHVRADPQAVNSGKGMLDRYADALAADPNATAVVVGYDNADERVPAKHRKALLPQDAARRAVNTKAYLVEEKGIDTRRIEVRKGTEDAQKVILWIVPAGATMDMSSTVSVDESPAGGA